MHWSRRGTFRGADRRRGSCCCFPRFTLRFSSRTLAVLRKEKVCRCKKRLEATINQPCCQQSHLSSLVQPGRGLSGSVSLHAETKHYPFNDFHQPGSAVTGSSPQLQEGRETTLQKMQSLVSPKNQKISDFFFLKSKKFLRIPKNYFFLKLSPVERPFGDRSGP